MKRPKTSRAKYRLVGRNFFLYTGAFALCAVCILNAQTAGAFLPTLFSAREGSTPPVPSGMTKEYAENVQTATILQAARHNDPNLSRGGGAITVTEGALVSEKSPYSGISGDQPHPARLDQISWHVVEERDTLSQIAAMYDVSVNTIVWANELSSNKDIRPGQTLLILPITGVRHTVAKGDTVESLAKKYSGNIEEILAYNDLLEGNTLVVGNVITIPGGAVEEVKPDTKKVAKGGSLISSGPSISGYYIHPLPGSVRTQGLHGYNAVDFGAPVGTPILASAQGKVIVSRAGGWNGGYGNYVVVDHANGTQTLYAHNSKNAVWQGQSVVQGQVIGYVGNTGRSTGPHLHFEVRGAKNPF